MSIDLIMTVAALGAIGIAIGDLLMRYLKDRRELALIDRMRVKLSFNDMNPREKDICLLFEIPGGKGHRPNGIEKTLRTLAQAIGGVVSERDDQFEVLLTDESSQPKEPQLQKCGNLPIARDAENKYKE